MGIGSLMARILPLTSSKYYGTMIELNSAEEHIINVWCQTIMRILLRLLGKLRGAGLLKTGTTTLRMFNHSESLKSSLKLSRKKDSDCEASKS